jgi:Cu/Ag efflux protein CusF
MKPRLWILTLIVCMAVWALAACSRQEPAAKNQTVQPSAEQPPAAPEPATAAASATAPDAQAATGELKSVDLVTKTLTIKNAAGNEQTFSFTDSTEVAGATGSQGLSNQQGNQVVVRYLEQDRHTAVRIEIVPR